MNEKVCEYCHMPNRADREACNYCGAPLPTRPLPRARKQAVAAWFAEYVRRKEELEENAFRLLGLTNWRI